MENDLGKEYSIIVLLAEDKIRVIDEGIKMVEEGETENQEIIDKLDYMKELKAYLQELAKKYERELRDLAMQDVMNFLGGLFGVETGDMN